MILGIHHIAIIVSSEKTLIFYKKFGFEEIYRKQRSYDVVVLLKGYGIELEIFVDSKHPSRSVPEPIGLRHLAFSVDSIEDTLSKLEINDCEIMLDWIERRYCFITDPDGNRIELHE